MSFYFIFLICFEYRKGQRQISAEIYVKSVMGLSKRLNKSCCERICFTSNDDKVGTNPPNWQLIQPMILVDSPGGPGAFGQLRQACAFRQRIADFLSQLLFYASDVNRR